MFSSYSENLRVRYVSQGLSKATIFNTIIILVTIIAPYLIGYRMQGFWVRMERFREQPNILFKHEALVILEVKNLEGLQDSLIWTTFPGLLSMLENQLTPLVSSREADTNFDSMRDFLEIEISLPLSKNLSVYGVHVLLLFEYKLHKYAILNMESMIFTSHQVGQSGNRYEFIGDVGLVQKEPLWNRFVDTRYNYDVVPRTSSRQKDYSLSNIINAYAYRNVSTILKNKYELWLNDADNKDEFLIKGRINYVDETYECWTGFWEMLKWAWVQYFSIFVIVYAILKLFQRVVYKARIFDTVLVVPWEKPFGTQPNFLN